MLAAEKWRRRLARRYCRYRPTAVWPPIASASSRRSARRSAASIFSSTMTARRRLAISRHSTTQPGKRRWSRTSCMWRACAVACCRIMQKSGGSILNITAISAIQPIPRFGLSVASWGAVIGYAKTLALEVGALRHQRQHYLPRLYRHTAAGEGVLRWREAGAADAQRARAGSAAGAYRHASAISPASSRCSCRRAAATSPAPSFRSMAACSAAVR